MGSCRDLSSALYTSRYISWFVESAGPQTPVNSTAEATRRGFPQPTGSGSVPLLLFSPAETGAGETNAAFSHQHTESKKTHQHEDDDGWKDGEGDLRAAGTSNRSNEDPSVPHADDDRFHLPRSSPVISRRIRPVSWHGGGTDTSSPTSLDYSSSPACASQTQDQHLCLAVGSMEDLGSKRGSRLRSSPIQEDKKQRSISISANLNSFLMSLFHLPFSGLTEELKGRGCDGRHSPVLSNSTQSRRERGCSGIPECPADMFKTSCELDKENAHFIVVDMVLEVLEGVKWNLNLNTRHHTDCQACGLQHEQQQEQMRGCRIGTTRQEKNQRRHSDEDNTHSSEDAHTQEAEDRNEAEHMSKTFSVLSTDSGFEDYGVEASLTQKDCDRNAESLAQQLVMDFKRSWLPSREPRRGRLSLRSSLQELPGTGSVAVSSSSLTEEIRLRTRMRGSLSWAPPRFQIIFTVQPSHRRSEVVTLQNFLCAGCGTKVEPKYIRKLRYCDYLGRYFCDCCHSGSEAVIPARVLSSWDFGRYPVSDFSKQLLESVCFQPLFDLTTVGKKLYSRVKELDKFRELQDQLLCIKKLLKACRLSESVTTEFQQLPAHLMEQPHLFSMDDLLRVKKGQLLVQARAVLQAAISHVENCKLCLARGFICEFCRDRDIIFPFQTDVCKRCPVCKTCFHKQCFTGKKCPKCARIQSRKKRPDGSVK